jgi:acetyl esterase/lipase
MTIRFAHNLEGGKFPMRPPKINFDFSPMQYGESGRTIKYDRFAYNGRHGGAHIPMLDGDRADARWCCSGRKTSFTVALADQVCRAIAWVHDNAAHFGGDPNQLYVGGQSSGAHLAAVALTTDWPGTFGVPADILKGGMCISGIYDLIPVSLSARSNYVEFDDTTTAALSPIRHLDRLRARLVVAYGTCETPEFQRQNREFAAAVEAAGKPVTLLVAENYNHFELPETLGNPYGLLGRAALDLMGFRER